MAQQIPRQTHKVFGSTGDTSKFGEFGSQVAGAPVRSKDLATIQGLPAWTGGFQFSLYAGNKAIFLQDLNSFALEHSTQLGYLLAAGLAEWDAATTYDATSVVKGPYGGATAGQWFASLQDVNLNNPPPAGASNAFWRWLNPPGAVIDTGGAATNALPKFEAPTSIGPATGSRGLTASAVSDDGVNVILTEPLKFPDGSVQAVAAQTGLFTNKVVNAGTIGNTYTNPNTPGAKPRQVTILAHMPANTASCIAYCDNGPINTKVGQISGAFNIDGIVYGTMTFLVLPGESYKVIGGVLDGWIEWR